MVCLCSKGFGLSIAANDSLVIDATSSQKARFAQIQILSLDASIDARLRDLFEDEAV